MITNYFAVDEDTPSPPSVTQPNTKQELAHTCPLCAKRTVNMYCVSCTSTTLQQRRIALSALQADVAVLRRKSSLVLSERISHDNDKVMETFHRIDELKSQLLTLRNVLCTERIQVAQKREERDGRMEALSLYRDGVEKCRQEVEELRGPLMGGLERQLEWQADTLHTLRRERLLEVYRAVGLDIHQVMGPIVVIASLPMPRSGNLNVVPHEVVAAALGRTIHFLLLATRYVPISYPYPMSYNSAHSSIGKEGKTNDVHVLVPDGSMGFEQGVGMLQQNVLFFCTSQSLPQERFLPPTDFLGNLIRMGNAPSLGQVI